MTYARKVEIQRERNRVTEERRKAHAVQASKSGSAKPIIQKPVEGPSIWRQMFDAVTGKAAAKNCEKCGTRNTLKQWEKRRGCPKCGGKK